MKHKIILFLTATLYLSNLFAQKEVIQKDDMYSDFDYLVSTLEKVSPHLYLKKQLTGYSSLDTIKTFRNTIENISSYDEFWELINKSLTTCQDGHTHIVTPNTPHNTIYENINLLLPLKYMEGKYIITRDFTYNNILFERGYKLIKLNDIAVSNFLLSVIPYRSNMKIDINTGNYYFDNFIFADNIIETGGVNLTFKTNDNAEIFEYFSFKESVQFIEDEVVFIDSKTVEYWPDLKILYIRMPSMDYADRKYYSKEIIETGKGKQIEKVIIDVRNNGGGSDITWINALRALIAKAIPIEYAIYGNDPSYMKNKYRRIHDIKHYTPENIAYLNNQKLYPYLKDSTAYKPYNNSLNLNCKIIMVGNDYVYSSGASIFKVASFADDNFYSIGTPTGTFLGSGFDPITFELPNSKIQFIVAPTLDLFQSNSVSDIMQDNFDFIIVPTLEEYKIKYAYIGNVWSKHFLTHFDPYIIQALKL